MSLSAAFGLLNLLNKPNLDEFFNTHWERSLCLARATIRGSEAGIFTVDAFEELASAIHASSGTELSIVDGHLAHSVNGCDAQPVAIYAAFQRGCTLLQSGLQLRWPPVARICREIENQFVSYGLPLAEAVGANAYLTPRDSQGFHLHYDNHCAIILQLHGSKNWSLFAPLEDMPVTRCERPIAREDLQPPILEVRLTAGDVLYIPRGFPHFARTVGEMSLHLTLSLRPLIWAEAIQALCQSDPAFRRSVSRVGNDFPAAQRYLIEELMPRLALKKIDRFLESRIAQAATNLALLPLGRLRALDRSADLTADTLVLRTTSVLCFVSEENGSAVLRFPGSTLELPAVMKPVFDFIAAHAEFTPAMLPAVGATYDRLQLVQILIARGLVQPVEGEASLSEERLFAGSAKDV